MQGSDDIATRRQLCQLFGGEWDIDARLSIIQQKLGAQQPALHREVASIREVLGEFYKFKQTAWATKRRQREYIDRPVTGWGDGKYPTESD